MAESNDSRLYWFDPAQATARGPLSPVQLRALAEGGVIGPDTLLAPPGATEWTRLADRPDWVTTLLPPREAYHLSGNRYAAAPEAPPELATDVYEVLAVNRSREDPDRLVISEADLRRKLSRRTRDFLTLIVGGNTIALLVLLLLHMGDGLNVVSGFFLVSGTIIWNAGLAWVTYGVMGRL